MLYFCCECLPPTTTPTPTTHPTDAVPIAAADTAVPPNPAAPPLMLQCNVTCFKTP